MLAPDKRATAPHSHAKPLESVFKGHHYQTRVVFYDCVAGGPADDPQ
jgi:hypothetical protein